jgi:ribosomal protein S18 acetylase RimI-like enzyme
VNDVVNLIYRLEHISLGGWPAIEEEEYDNWILRASSGYTGRANSIVPLDRGIINIEEKLQYCESWYNLRGLPVTFKLTEASNYLTPYLDLRKYGVRQQVNVQTLDISSFIIKQKINANLCNVDDWIDAYWFITNQPDDTLSIHLSLLNILDTKADFAVITIEDKPVCCGVCINQGECAGIFDIYTSPNARKYGFALELILNLINISKERGNQYMYLQVIADNIPAISLYEKLGFKTQYQYWYRYQQKVN